MSGPLLSWEIINPSDKYTLQARDFATAAAVCLLLGEGRYGLRPEHEDGQECPMFLFGGHETFLAEHFGGDLSAWITEHKDAMVECLDSVLLGGFGRRADFDAAVAAVDDPEKLEAFREAWLDNRSSMNNIGGYAKQIADHLRAN